MKTDKEILAKWRCNHHRALESLRSNDCNLSGVQLWRKCIILERIANTIATAACNGERVRVQFPFRKGVRKMIFEFDFSSDYDKAHDVVCDNLREEIRATFGHVPQGFFVNFDARGYTLKISSDENELPEGLHQDLGRNGILAAQIN